MEAVAILKLELHKADSIALHDSANTSIRLGLQDKGPQQHHQRLPQTRQTKPDAPLPPANTHPNHLKYIDTRDSLHYHKANYQRVTNSKLSSR